MTRPETTTTPSGDEGAPFAEASPRQEADALREQGIALAKWARARLAQELGGPRAHPPEGDWCDKPGATFVTLRWHDGHLQGCIGSIEARRGIVADVAHNAIAAGLYDPRSEPLTLERLDELHLELSILSPLEPIAFSTEEEALTAIRPGTDGIVLDWGGYRATFLPSMWPVFGDVATFMRELRRKAGLPAHFWAPDVKLRRYTVDKYEDEGPRGPLLVPENDGTTGEGD